MITETQFEELIEANRRQNLIFGITKIIFVILFVVVFVFILWKLSKAVARGVKEHKAGKVAICMTISLIMFWPVAIGQGIYLLLEWRREPQMQNDHYAPPTAQTNKKPFTQADFDRWKQDKGGFIDLDAPIILPWQKTA